MIRAGSHLVAKQLVKGTVPKAVVAPVVATVAKTIVNVPKAATVSSLATVGARAYATLSPNVNLPPTLQQPFKSVPEPPMIPASFTLKSGEKFEATSFGAPLTNNAVSGEVVFTTSLVGYPESMTDPSYRGQILVFTQPLIGNYGVPAPVLDEYGLLRDFESDRIQVKAIIVNDYATKYSHWKAIESLGQWCARYGIAALTGVDTRAVVSLLREKGSTLGEIRIGENLLASKKTALLEDPNKRNLVAEASVKTKMVYNKGADLKIALIDCGVKQNIIRHLVKRGAEVTVVPWDHDITKDQVQYDGVFISNGPGDPRHATKTVQNLRKLMSTPTKVPIPIFGICMGNQILGLAAGFGVYKLPYGNRGHNQPAMNLVTNQCVITSQNHGYALDDSEMVNGWIPYFRNANDGSNEGIRHAVLPYSSVQFHPEAKGGPQDTEYLFTNFIEDVRAYKEVRQAAGKVLFPVANMGISSTMRQPSHQNHAFLN
ncbi:Multifunctional pyrimidine synthesis protein CAD [Quaeritorhiza haematococci]|nr:Multifunctional pyrimidine synthesis protein CAD [Quaeritorhiza haematococci]